MSIPHVFANPALLEQALTHSSMAVDGKDNQRFEFLGDAVLQLVLNEWLLETRPEWPEGTLSKASARLVNASTLAQLADGWALGEQLRLGKGERANNVAANVDVRADAFEAVVGAIYLDAGLAAVRRAVVPLMAARLEQVDTLIDCRSFLQEWAQKNKLALPAYVVVAEVGQAHAKTFSVEVALAGRRFGPGQGSSKRAASAEAARIAIDGLGLALADD